MRPRDAKTLERAKNIDRDITTGDDIPGQLTELNRVINPNATYAPASSFGEVTNKTDRAKDQLRKDLNRAELSNLNLSPTPNPSRPPHTSQTPPLFLTKPISRKVLDLHHEEEKGTPVVQPNMPDEQPKPPIHQTPHRFSSISSDSHNNEAHEARESITLDGAMIYDLLDPPISSANFHPKMNSLKDEKKMPSKFENCILSPRVKTKAELKEYGKGATKSKT